MIGLKIKYSLLPLILLFGIAFAGQGKEEIRHEFLVLSAGDLSYHGQQEKARKRLSKQGENAVRIAIEYMDRKSIRKAIAIKWIVEDAAEDAVVPLTYVLTRPDKGNAAFAAYLLGKIGSRKAAVPLMLAAGSSSERLRSASIGALGECGDTCAVPILLQALTDSLASVRRKAAHSLGLLEDKRALDDLISLLGDSSSNVRYAASYAISRIGGEGATMILLERLDKNSGGKIERYHIIETLGALGSKESLPVLYDLLEDPFYLNRGFACQALGHYRGNYEVANALKRSLHDASGFVGMMSRKALSSIRN